MKRLFFITFTLFFTLLSIGYAEVSPPHKLSLESELNESELSKVLARELVVKTQDVPGSPWPEITYYALIEATPLEAIGLFAAYDLQKDYIPGVIKSTPIKHVTATDVQTEYELHIPFPLSNAHYVHGTRLYKHNDDYETIWYMVQSTSAEEVRGGAYFESYKGMTLFRYRSYVKPKSIFGSLVKKVMFKDVEKSILAIKAFIEKAKKENPGLVSKYSEFITRALQGEFVYQTIIDKK